MDLNYLVIAAGFGLCAILVTIAIKRYDKALKDALDSSFRQASALEARRAKDPARGPDGRFIKKGGEA